MPTDEGAQWAEEEGLLFVEASAKSGANVEGAFEAAARDILSKIRRGVWDDDRVRFCFTFLLLLATHPIFLQLCKPGPTGGIVLDQNKTISEGPCCW